MHRWQFLHFACLSPNSDQCAARRRPQSAKRIFFSWNRNHTRKPKPKFRQNPQFSWKVFETKVKKCSFRHILKPVSRLKLEYKFDYQRVKNQFIQTNLSTKIKKKSWNNSWKQFIAKSVSENFYIYLFFRVILQTLTFSNLPCNRKMGHFLEQITTPELFCVPWENIGSAFLDLNKSH